MIQAGTLTCASAETAIWPLLASLKPSAGIPLANVALSCDSAVPFAGVPGSCS